MRKTMLKVLFAFVCILLCSCDNQTSTNKNDVEEQKIEKQVSTEVENEDEAVDSVEFFTWINSFEIQAIDHIIVEKVEDDKKVGSISLVKAYKANSDKSQRGIYISVDNTVILYTGLEIYADDFVVIGNYLDEDDEDEDGVTYPVYVRKSEMIKDWNAAYLTLDPDDSFNIHWSEDIWRKREKQDFSFPF